MKKIICLILSVILLITPAFAHPNQDVIDKWQKLGWLNGDLNGIIRPDDNITRAEFVKLVNCFKGYKELGDISQYTDVKKDKWYYEDIQKALAAGYINGTSKTTMSPEKLITNAEALVIAARLAALDISVPKMDAFEQLLDKEEIPLWAVNPIAAALNAGFDTLKEKKINPKEYITRAETVVLLDRIYSDTRVFTLPCVYDTTISCNNVSLKSSGITLKNMKIKENLTIENTVAEGSINFENINLAGKLSYINKEKIKSEFVKCTINDIVSSSAEINLTLSRSTSVSFINFMTRNSSLALNDGSTVKTLNMSDSGMKVILNENTTIDTLTVNSQGAVIETEEKSLIKTLTLNKNAAVKGAGSIELLYINANECFVEMKPAELVLKNDVIASVGGVVVSNNALPADPNGFTPSTVPVFLRHDIPNDINVTQGTLFNSLNLPTSAMLFATQNEACIAALTWDSRYYEPNFTGTQILYALLSAPVGQTLPDWVPDYISIKITVK